MSYNNPPAFTTLPGTFTFAGLNIAYPPAAAVLGLYATVTDLYGTQTGKMYCGYDSNHTLNGGYFWQPVRPDSTNLGAGYASNVALTILPIAMPNFIRFTSAALAANVAHAVSSVNAYPGYRVRMLMPGLLGVFGVTLTGTLGTGVAASLLQNTPRELIWDGAAYQNYQ